jgi:hypothetical protein
MIVLHDCRGVHYTVVPAVASSSRPYSIIALNRIQTGVNDSATCVSSSWGGDSRIGNRVRCGEGMVGRRERMDRDRRWHCLLHHCHCDCVLPLGSGAEVHVPLEQPPLHKAL